jgi:amino acid transporter
MYMVGPLFWRIAFRIFVVLVGFLILSGAINTSMIGSTGVLMRVAEDGVLTDWFRKPHADSAPAIASSTWSSSSR